MGDMTIRPEDAPKVTEQVTESDAGERTTDVRFFISSLPSRMLSPTQKLQLVRLHWGIENNRHWTLDAVFEEDDRQPCQLSRRSVEVVCWLRALAYNLVATLRTAAKQKDCRPQPWRRTMQRKTSRLCACRREPRPGESGALRRWQCGHHPSAPRGQDTRPDRRHRTQRRAAADGIARESSRR